VNIFHVIFARPAVSILHRGSRPHKLSSCTSWIYQLFLFPPRLFSFSKCNLGGLLTTHFFVDHKKLQLVKLTLHHSHVSCWSSRPRISNVAFVECRLNIKASISVLNVTFKSRHKALPCLCGKLHWSGSSQRATAEYLPVEPTS
jgi:hypothetical protein